MAFAVFTIRQVANAHKAFEGTVSGQTQDTQPNGDLVIALQDALAHLHDPCYQMAPTLANLLGTIHWDLAREEVARAIEDLAPPPDAPVGSPAVRFHAILHSRYVLGQTQEAVAEQLGISVRHLRRQQGEAVHWLADRLHLSLTADQAPSSATPWMAQVCQELEALGEDTEGATCMVGQVITKVAALVEPLVKARSVTLRHQPVSANLVAGIDATALRQVLLVTLDRMTTAKGGTGPPEIVEMAARRDGDRIQVTLTAHPAPAIEPPFDYLVDQIVSRCGGRAAWQVHDAYATASLYLPGVRLCPILVVDDNEDLVHFYRRYLAGTRYPITHKANGADIVEAAEACAAEIIVLDVMLPDVDGWELLTHLHQHPATRHIPVLVCTVVRAEEMALALGAAAYLAKPVRRAEFIAALDRLRGLQQARESG